MLVVLIRFERVREEFDAERASICGTKSFASEKRGGKAWLDGE